MGFNSSQLGDGNITNVVIKSRYALLDTNAQDNAQIELLVVQAVQIDSKISKGLYRRMGEDTDAMYPRAFGDSSEDCNCRCCLLQRAKWALSEEEYYTKYDGDKNELVRIEAKTYNEFKQKANETLINILKSMRFHDKFCDKKVKKRSMYQTLTNCNINHIKTAIP